MNPKQRAAEAALPFIHDNMLVGLGTGSTADYFIAALAQRLRDGALHNIRGVPTSVQSERRALELGIPLVPLETGRPDVTVDGADEVSDDLQLIKGLGGALLREKIVAQNSQRLIIIADASKRVAKLGVRSPLPVEVVPFAHQTHVPFLAGLGCTPNLRKTPDGAPFRTDNGNLIYDCRFPAGLHDPAALQSTLRSRAGIVETGLFLGLAAAALIADNQQVIQLNRP
jgi:ribose 5-phosphate isomerase A